MGVLSVCLCFVNPLDSRPQSDLWTVVTERSVNDLMFAMFDDSRWL